MIGQLMSHGLWCRLPPQCLKDCVVSMECVVAVLCAWDHNLLSHVPLR